jgi:hypothetical protein
MRFFTGGSGLGGTMVCGPVEVATRISRRHRRGLHSANCHVRSSQDTPWLSRL